MLRADVSEVREEVAVLRTLVDMGDRDVAEVRPALAGIVRTQNALRETQLEQHKILGEHGKTLRGLSDTVGALVVGQDRHETLLTELAEGQAELRGVVAGLAEGQAEILRRLGGEGAGVSG